jgi:hypothetical protein
MVTLPRRLAIVTKLPFSRLLPAAKKKPPTVCGSWLLQSSDHFGRFGQLGVNQCAVAFNHFAANFTLG